MDGDDASFPYGLFMPLSGGTMQGPLVTSIGSSTAGAIQIGSGGPIIYNDSGDIAFSSGGVTADVFTASQMFMEDDAAMKFIAVRTDATLAANSAIFAFQAEANNSAGSSITWASFQFEAVDTTAGSETGALYLRTEHGGALVIDFTVYNGNFCAGSETGQQVISSAGGIVGIQASPYTQTAPTTGFSITIGNAINFLILTPAGTLATGTVKMPASPQDGQEVTVSSTQIISALTVSANAGQTIDGGITAGTFAANSFAKWKYVLATTTWYRVG